MQDTTDADAKIAALEDEVARLRAELAARDASAAPPGEDPGVTRVLQDRALLANLPDVIGLLDRQHRILYLNRVVPSRRIEDMLGTSVLDYLVDDERESRLAALERVWTTGKTQVLETRSTHGFVWDNRMVPIFDGDRVAYLLVTSMDVTERKRAEDAVRESASMLRHAIDATGMGTWVRDSDGVRWDEALCRILGVEYRDAPRPVEGFLDTIHPDDRERTRAVVGRARNSGNFESLECRVVRPDGTVRHVLVKASVELDSKREPLRSFGGVFDMTEKKLLEDQLRHAQKMDAIGHLTAGIAHNFNNILGVILPNVELCRRQAPPEIASRLSDIMHAAERGAEMVRELMLFAKREATVRMEATSLGDCVRRTAAICRTSFDPSITIEVSVASDVPFVLGNAGRIEQVLLNVCINARDALTDARTPSPRIALLADRAPSGAGRVRIVDNGPGMDDATREKVFDPFFTTKGVQRGTGLGLATAYAIVGEHGGTIACRSRVGEGTTFEVELPASESAPLPAPNASAMPRAIAGEAVLLVDDEPLVRSATRALLELGGYRVVEAVDGAAAIATFERERRRIAAVVLDRAMPGMSGEHVLARLVAIDPAVPVVVLSGHLGSTDGWELASEMLTKPVSATLLLQTVRRSIDRSRVRVAS